MPGLWVAQNKVRISVYTHRIISSLGQFIEGAVPVFVTSSLPTAFQPGKIPHGDGEWIKGLGRICHGEMGLLNGWITKLFQLNRTSLNNSIRLGMTEVTVRGDAVANEGFDFLGLGKASGSFTAKEFLAVQNDAEGSRRTREEGDLTQFAVKGGQKFLCQPGGSREPAAAGAIVNFQSGCRHVSTVVLYHHFDALLGQDRIKGFLNLGKGEAVGDQTGYGQTDFFRPLEKVVRIGVFPAVVGPASG